MTSTRPAEILRQLGQSAEPDAELLARFAATKDAGAFAELVCRHGPLVFGVCRRVTGHPQDAEDAFQATFLVLAKKAGSLRNAALLGNWLYGVACRVAWRSKRSVLRRKRREVAVSALPEVPAPSPSPVPELGPILNEEVAALPAQYRDAIVLCDLRGVSRAAAAAALGIPEGTLSSRLANGRKRLAARLTKRGVALSTAALPAALSEAATAAVPNELLTKTCGLVADWSAGDAVPGPLARLAQGGFTMRKAFLLVAVMALAAGGAVLAARSNDDPPPNAPPKPPVVAQKPVEKPKPGDKGEVKFGAPVMRLATDVVVGQVQVAAWSRDGRFFAMQGMVLDVQKPYPCATVLMIHNGKFASYGTFATSGFGDLVGFTPDSREVITEKREYHLVSGFHWLRFESMPEDIGKAIKDGYNSKVRTVNLDLPETHGYAFAPDGKTFRTVAWHRDAGVVKTLEVLEVDAATGKAKKSLLKLDYGPYGLSANGKRLAVLDKDCTKVTVYDLDRGARQFDYAVAEGKFANLPRVSPSPGVTEPQREREVTMAFSPDARRLFVSRAIGQSVVLNAETGKTMPPLESAAQSRLRAEAHAFTGDGRLLAMRGTSYGDVNMMVPDGQKGRVVAVRREVATFLAVWDTESGKVVKRWDSSPRVLFHPSKPVLAILEPNGENQTRLGLWDFSAEVEKK